MRSFLLLAFSCLLLNASAQWKTATPFSSSLRDIQFADQYHGFACAQSGSIGLCQETANFYRTIDGGRNWIRMITGTTGQPQAIHFIDPFTGWIALNSSGILKTSDGGESWTQQTFGVGSGYNDIWFVNANKGFVLGNNGLLRKSTNGGSSWQTISSGTNSALRRIHFSSENVGVIAVSGGEILRTEDGGSSWDLLDFGASSINYFSFVSELEGFAVGYFDGDGALFATSDGGESWSVSPMVGALPLRCDFRSTQLGYVVSDGGEIWKTTDGGESWNVTTTMNGISDNWQGIDFLNDQEGYICGNRGQISKTEDGGATWKSQTSGFSAQVNTVETLHRDTLFLGDTRGRIFRSDNAAINLKQVAPEIEGDGINKINELNEEEVVAAGFHSISKSSDRGETWSEKANAGTLTFSDMHFPTEEVGYVSTLDTLLYKTTDGGENWEVLTLSFEEYYRTVWFISEQTGFVASDDNVYKTSDGGASWTIFSLEQFPLSITGTVRDMVFSSSEIGYLVSSQQVFWTLDGGETWEERGETGGNTINELWFANDSLGYFTRNTSQGITQDSCATLSSSSTACLANNWSMHGIDMTDGGDFGYSVGGLNGLLHAKEQRETLAPFTSLQVVCPNSPLFVGFIAKGLWFGDHEYRVELSDASGNFSFPITIGTADLTETNVYQSTITQCTVPNVAAGSGYRIRVVNDVLETVSPDNGYDITISPSIAPTCSIAGSTPSGICPGDEVELFATHTGGGLNPVFEWSLNGEVVQIGSEFFSSSTLQEGDVIQLTMESSLACAAPTSVVSNSYVVTASPLIETDLPNTLQLCEQLELQLNGNTNYAYSWQAAEGIDALDIPNPTISPEQSTVFQYTATDENGCMLMDSVAVELLELPSILTESPTICTGDEVLLEATQGGTYNWSPAELLSNPAIYNPTANPTEGLLFFAEIVGANGCENTDSILVSVDDAVQILTETDPICNGEALQLEAGEGEIFEWFPVDVFDDATAASPTAVLSETTVLYLEATTLVGCQSTDSLLVEVIPMVDVAFANETEVCPDACIQLDPQFSAEVNNFAWSPPFYLSATDIPDPIACLENAIMYVLDFEDANGCANAAFIEFNLYNAAPAATISFDDVILSSTDASSYQWLLNGEPIDGANEQTYLPLENGNYSILTTDENGCEGISDDFLVTTIGVAEWVTTTEWQLLRISGESHGYALWSAKEVSKARFAVVDAQGRVVMEEKATVFPNTQAFQANADNWSGGIYLMQVWEGGKLLFTERFVR